MLQVNFNPFPVLKTNRLLLRRIVPGDAPAFYEQRRDKELMQYIARPLATCLEDVQKLMDQLDNNINNNESINWTITMPPDDTMIGSIGFVRMNPEHYRAEVGYMLGAAWHGKGIMTEALEAVINYGFKEMKLHSIEGGITPKNIASARTLEKAGFVREGLFRENYFWEGEFSDSAVYGLLRSDRAIK